jgi:iron(III) transport system permease protein
MLGTLIPLFILLPFIHIIMNFFKPASLYYQSLMQNNIIRSSVLTTLELIGKVGFFAAFIGFMLAYFMTFYRFKRRKLLNILLIIPLCIPVYVAAYTYSNIYYYLPFLEMVLRSDFMMNGAVFIYAFFLYPYVYLASRSYLSKHLTDFIESSHILGENTFKTFIKIVLPLSRPIIVGSVLFVLFETLSDFAVVEYYGILTLSRYVNLSWFASGDFVSASKFSIYVLMLMFAVILIERLFRRKKRYTSSDTVQRPIVKETPNGFLKFFIYVFMTLVILLAVIFPLTQMIVASFMNYELVSNLKIISITLNSLIITMISIIIIVMIALLLTTITIHTKGIKKHVLSSYSTIGYMVPSMVLALGLYLIFIQIDQQLYKWFNGIGLNRMLITSSIIIIIIGFFVKFFSVAYTNFLAVYKKIDSSLLEASLTLGETRLSTLFRVTIPMLKKSIIAVSIILFIDMFKELTIVYSLRPFNFKTLSTEVYRYAGNEMVNVAAFPSLVIVVICVLLVIYLEGGFKRAKTK